MSFLRHLFCSTTAVLAVAAAFAQAAQPAQTSACVEIEVHQVRPRQGFLMLAAYGDAASFNKKPLLSLRLPADDVVTRVQLCGLPADGSDVAITMYQDLDGNGQMGQNLLGIPTEPWGSSGTPGTFGPTWPTAKVARDGKAIVVKLSS
jgi:uncharacterized protein (DUF2141 family)